MASGELSTFYSGAHGSESYLICPKKTKDGGGENACLIQSQAVFGLGEAG